MTKQPAKKTLLTTLSRRRFLTLGAATAGLVITPKLALSILPPPKPWCAERSLTLHNVHTGETFDHVYWRGGEFVKPAIAQLNHFLRDRRNGLVTNMNPELYDLLHKLSADCETQKPFHIICGYRSPHTNHALHAKSHGVAKNSLHMKGQAIDLNLEGTPLKDLRDAAIAQKAGGVGYYAKSNFIHVDIRDKPTHWG